MDFFSFSRMFDNRSSWLLSPVKDEDVSWKRVTLFGVFYLAVGFAFLLPKFWEVSLANARSSSHGVIMSMVNSGFYREWMPEYQIYFIAHRFPITIWVYSALAAIVPSNIAFVFIVKNLLFIPLLLAALAAVIRLTHPLRIVAIGAAIIVLFNPTFIQNAFNISPEECFTIPLLAAFYMVCLRMYYLQGRAQLLAFAWAGLIGGVLYLSKSSLIAVSIVMPLTVLLVTMIRSTNRMTRHHLQLGAVAFAPVILAMLLWGTFVELHTGKFRCDSSYNGMNFYKGNNDAALGYYPRDLDFLPGRFPVIRSHDEWEINDQFISMTFGYIKSHPKEWLTLTLQKCFVLFVEIRRTPLSETVRAVDIVTAVFMLVFRTLVSALLILAGFHLFRRTHKEARFPLLLFMAFLVCYSAPFIAGFCYTRHVIPIMLPAIFLAFSIFGEPMSCRSR